MCIPVRCRCNSGYLTHILIGNANAYIRVNVVACRDDPAIAPGHRKRMKISSWESISVSNTAVLLNIVVGVLYGEIYSTPKPGAHEPHWTSMHAHWPSLCTYVTVGNRMANSSSVFIRNCMCNGLIPHCIQTYRDAYMERRWVCMVCVCVRSMAGCLLIHKCSCGFLSNVEVDVGARCDFGRLQQFRLFHLLLAKIA